MLLSIIVPICNVAPYLEKCLQSIQTQSFKDFECIMVDDGSIDDSRQIAQSFCDQDDRFKLIASEHGGLAHAQNLALKEVKGEYITFCDGDDYLSAGAYENVLPIIEKKPDLIISNLYFEYADQTRRNSAYKLPNLTNREQIVNHFPEIYKQQMMYYDTNKIYHKSILRDLKFENLTVGLDTVLNYEVFARCNNIYFSEKPYYHYLQRQGSLVNHFDAQRLMIREYETQSLVQLLAHWNPEYASQLINLDWYNTLTNTVKNVYAFDEHNQLLKPKQRIYYLKNDLKVCLQHMRVSLLSDEQRAFIDEVKSVVAAGDDQEFIQRFASSNLYSE
ncbi:glycosyltransferase family 2 protein [Ligilactobacillus cholophilus]|uniref:glycosyltransferase family 2 protein n=1 Tax=Ligilactobacillus cholophilus TaxID=3050131 RepID=UPI0025B0A79C|nr:glycosyltransferase family 2 protein [Ligilactobacillus cholophilus]